jgi:hypothetical protein
MGRWERRRAVKGSITPRSLPDRLGRNEFVDLRTGHSPQVALHPPSQERSYHFRLQAGNVSLIGTCTLLFKRLHRRTGAGFPACHADRNVCPTYSRAILRLQQNDRYATRLE